MKYRWLSILTWLKSYGLSALTLLRLHHPDVIGATHHHPPTNSAYEWLEHEDGVTRSERASRAEWLITNYPPATGFLIPGGWVSKQLLEEVKYCFIYGQYVAVAVLGVAFLERIFAANFYAAGRNDLERAGGFDLLKEALHWDWLTKEEYHQFDQMRRLRNPLAHFRRPLAKHTLEARAVEENEHPIIILEGDAKNILEGVLTVLKKQAIF